jgi:hypothetical protein
MYDGIGNIWGPYDIDIADFNRFITLIGQTLSPTQ